MSCKNIFLEPDGYCTSCCQNHFQVNGNGDITTPRNRGSRKPSQLPTPTPQPKTREQSVEDNIRNTPEFRLARELTNLLSEVFEVEVEVHFTNRSGACRITRNGKHHIEYGYGFLRDIYIDGYMTSYKTLRYIQNWERKFGEDGIKWIVAHEFAHVLQRETPGGRTYNSCHNEVFVEKWQEVLEVLL